MLNKGIFVLVCFLKSDNELYVPIDSDVLATPLISITDSKKILTRWFIMWNLVEFREKCNAQGIPPTENFIEAMDHAIRRSRFHARMSNSYWDNLYLNPEVNEVDYYSPEAFDAELKSEFEFIAALQAIHPIADLMAQIVNAVLLNNQYQIHQVTLNRVRERLSERQEFTTTLEKINALTESDGFTFIDGFVNTIKHRQLN